MKHPWRGSTPETTTPHPARDSPSGSVAMLEEAAKLIITATHDTYLPSNTLSVARVANANCQEAQELLNYEGTAQSFQEGVFQ